MTDEIECSVCGRSLVVTVAAFIGIKINLPTSPVDPAEEAEMREVLAPYQPGAHYYVCFPCSLAAFGIKPPDTGV